MRATLKIASIFSLGLAIAACSDETGKYTTGPDDPARKVTPADIAQVEKLLDDQEKADRAQGLRASAPALTEEQLQGGNPHESPHGYDKTVAQAQREAAAQGGRSIDLKFVTGTLPEGWEQVPPGSSMRLAEARIPRSGGDPEDGELGVFYFGPDAGSVQMNLDRWYGQFIQPDGSPSNQAGQTEEYTVNGMKVTFVNLGGTMKPTMMPGQPANAGTPKEKWRMLAAIVMTAEGPLFLKATGPEKTMTDNTAKMKAFVGSLAPAGAAPAQVAAAPRQAPEPVAPNSAAVPAPSQVTEGGAGVDLGPLTGTIPEGWQGRQPSSPMRAAEMTISKVEGDPEDGQLVVFYFGAGQGGSIEDNLSRWYGQFSQPDGRPSEEVAQTEPLMVGDMRAILVDLPGTMEPSAMPGVAPTPRQENWRMLAAIVMSPQGPVFFKATGPDATMTANKDKMRELVNSLKAK